MPEYALLKDIFRPLLSNGESHVVGSSILLTPLQMHTVISDSEWHVEEIDCSYEKLIEGESLINRLQMRKTLHMLERMSNANILENMATKDKDVIRKYIQRG